jgi:hypothetical protein
VNIGFGQFESVQGGIIMNEKGIDLGAAIDTALCVTLKDFDVLQMVSLERNMNILKKEGTKMENKALQPGDLARVIASKYEMENVSLEHFREHAIVRLRERVKRQDDGWITTDGWYIHGSFLEPLKERDFRIGDTVVFCHDETRRMTVIGCYRLVLHLRDSEDSLHAHATDCFLVEDYVGDTSDSDLPSEKWKTGDVARYTQTDGVSVLVRLESDLGRAWNTNVGLVDKEHLSSPYPLRKGDFVKSKRTHLRAVVQKVFTGSSCLEVRFGGGSYDIVVPLEAIQPLEIQPNGCLHGLFGKDDFPCRPGWDPTEDQYRECCGRWKESGRSYLTKVTPDVLCKYDSYDKFKEWAQHAEKIEGIPEQCVPKAEPAKEYYAIRYPLLMGIMD